LGSNPVVWQSKLQTEITLPMMAAEYVTLSAAMRSLPHLQNVHHEVIKELNLLWMKESSISSIYKDNQACIILATTDLP